jgi:hypothetical protein
MTRDIQTLMIPAPRELQSNFNQPNELRDSATTIIPAPRELQGMFNQPTDLGYNSIDDRNDVRDFYSSDIINQNVS